MLSIEFFFLYINYFKYLIFFFRVINESFYFIMYFDNSVLASVSYTVDIRFLFLSISLHNSFKFPFFSFSFITFIFYNNSSFSYIFDLHDFRHSFNPYLFFSFSSIITSSSISSSSEDPSDSVPYNVFFLFSASFVSLFSFLLPSFSPQKFSSDSSTFSLCWYY